MAMVGPSKREEKNVRRDTLDAFRSGSSNVESIESISNPSRASFEWLFFAYRE
jgi:hypothetical protein